MALLRRADEVVIAEIHRLRQIAKILRNFVGEGLRLEPGSLGGFLHFLAMLVGAREELHLLAVKTHESGDHIARQCRIGMPDVGRIIHVVDGRRYVIGVAHASLLPRTEASSGADPH